MSAPPTKTLTREQIHNAIWSLAAKRTDKDPKELQPSQRLIQDLGADSLDMAEFAMELEEQLGITLPNEVNENPNLSLGEIEQALFDKFGKPANS